MSAAGIISLDRQVRPSYHNYTNQLIITPDKQFVVRFGYNLRGLPGYGKNHEILPPPGAVSLFDQEGHWRANFGFRTFSGIVGLGNQIGALWGQKLFQLGNQLVPLPIETSYLHGTPDYTIFGNNSGKFIYRRLVGGRVASETEVDRPELVDWHQGLEWTHHIFHNFAEGLPFSGLLRPMVWACQPRDNGVDSVYRAFKGGSEITQFNLSEGKAPDVNMVQLPYPVKVQDMLWHQDALVILDELATKLILLYPSGLIVDFVLTDLFPGYVMYNTDSMTSDGDLIYLLSLNRIYKITTN